MDVVSKFLQYLRISCFQKPAHEIIANLAFLSYFIAFYHSYEISLIRYSFTACSIQLSAL